MQFTKSKRVIDSHNSVYVSCYHYHIVLQQYMWEKDITKHSRVVKRIRLKAAATPYHRKGGACRKLTTCRRLTVLRLPTPSHSPHRLGKPILDVRQHLPTVPFYFVRRIVRRNKIMWKASLGSTYMSQYGNSKVFNIWLQKHKII